MGRYENLFNNQNNQYTDNYVSNVMKKAVSGEEKSSPIHFKSPFKETSNYTSKSFANIFEETKQKYESEHMRNTDIHRTYEDVDIQNQKKNNPLTGEKQTDANYFNNVAKAVTGENYYNFSNVQKLENDRKQYNNAWNNGSSYNSSSNVANNTADNNENSDTNSNKNNTSYVQKDNMMQQKQYQKDEEDKLTKQAIHEKKHSLDFSMDATDIIEQMLRTSDVYIGYKVLSRAYQASSSPVISGIGRINYETEYMHYNYSALNLQLKKYGFKEITKSDNFSAKTFNHNLIKSLKAQGVDVDHIEYGMHINKDLNKGQLKVVLSDGSKKTVDLNKTQIKTKDGFVSGTAYTKKFLSAHQDRTQTISKNMKNINAYIKNHPVLSQLGLQNMTSREIKKRLSYDKKNKTWTFKDAHGTKIALDDEVGKALQDIGHYVAVNESDKYDRITSVHKKRVFKRETRRLIRDSDIYKGYAVTKRSSRIIIKIISSPARFTNSRINARRKYYEKKEEKYQKQKKKYDKKVEKGKRVSARQTNKYNKRTKKHLKNQSIYDRYYGQHGLFTNAQNFKKNIKNTVKGAAAKTGHMAMATTVNTTRNAARFVGRTTTNFTKRKITAYRSQHAKVDRILKKQEWLWGQAKKGFYSATHNRATMAAANAARFVGNHVHVIKWTKQAAHIIKTPFDFLKKSIKTLLTVVLIAIFAPILLVALFQFTVPIVITQISSGVGAVVYAKAYKEGIEQSAASTKDLYELLKTEYPSMSTADALGIMSVMKYKSNLNCFYEDENTGAVGLIGFTTDEIPEINQICADNGWNSAFDMEIEDNDGANEDIANDKLGITVKQDSIVNARTSQCRYIATHIINSENYPTNTTMSPDTMTEQAIRFAQIRGIDTSDIEILNAVKKNATDMYYEYVMWNFEYLEVPEDTTAGKLLNNALLSFARTSAGEKMNMNAMYPDTSYASISSDWSAWFVKYTFDNAELEDVDLSYVETNYTNIENMIDEADNLGFWHPYEEVLNTDAGTDDDGNVIDNGGIKDGYIVITSTGTGDDQKYHMGIVFNHKYSWDVTEKNTSFFTTIEGDSYGNNYLYTNSERKNLGYFGNEEETVVCSGLYSMLQMKCNQTTQFDEDVNIEGFIAWYDPVYSMTHHEWRQAEDARIAAEEEQARLEEEERQRQEEEAKRQDKENENNTDNTDEETPDSENEGTDNTDDADNTDKSEDTEIIRKCIYCGVTEDNDEAEYDCDFNNGIHEFR